MPTVVLKNILKSDLPKHSNIGDILICVDTCEVYLGNGESKGVTMMGVTEPTPSVKYRYEKINDWLYRRISKNEV